ncbi:MAG: HAD family phosphatase [Halobacteriales archaeon]|nr:HAD family phosphatase [Halobacteriales archaeon]
MNHEAVFFDMDGVTVDTASVWAEVEREHVLPNALDTSATEEVRAEALEAVRGQNVNDVYDTLVSMGGVRLTVDRSGFDALYAEKGEYVYSDATLMEGYRDMLSSLVSDGRHVGIVSASRRAWVEMVLDRFDLRGAFDAVVSADDIDGPSKPDPTTYRQAAEEVGVVPERAVAVEDSPHGIAAAVGAGMRCVAYLDEGERAEADLSSAHGSVGTPSELRRLILDGV